MNYHQRRHHYVPTPKPAPSTALRDEVESLREEIASLRKAKGTQGKVKRAIHDDVNDDDDEPLPAHRRRSKKSAAHSTCYKILCWGCEPSCFRESTSTVASCCCDMSVVVFKMAGWMGVVFFILWLQFR